MDFADIDENTTIREVLALHPGTSRVFREFGMQCLGCAHSVSESLAQAGAVHGVNVDELIHQLCVFLAEAED